MARVQKTADLATAAADKMGARVRMTEGNTCYRGGKPGVSNVFAAALWSADYSLLLASNNYSGINLHGGTGKSVANSVGGSLPGDGLLKDKGETEEQIAAHPHPFYTPIATFGAENMLEPVAYGLKFAGALSGGSFVKGDFTAKLQAAGVDATAYARQTPRRRDIGDHSEQGRREGSCIEPGLRKRQNRESSVGNAARTGSGWPARPTSRDLPQPAISKTASTRSPSHAHRGFA